ncbi:ergothioneine biosynthesis protein EgtB [Streptomyces albireticuli]|uniref:Hercynine oxygenase n=1 Tax=Streptomyces albireticuli TaxID=1940 RepID=A0A2A2DFZ4_9ACTN|nr:ergothioneine biosynthesis protein EgtB [Streptomyces albireticuli]MCD9141166.1 ergothioneine biosynthesis protein EgtB [Streptomyces albireticuli]MCD9160873.1 ergothioneine biosynthesis protein EgtB [Streptomyces albireticuli]MCD9191070.1 ergothioneine biosynthesis protein EgtB [Streptomyces albireticuli]PAU50411.1 sulfatase-modifying factor 1 [Streptomyces albireticuli]
MTVPELDPAVLRRRAADALRTARARTHALTGCVDGRELTAQHSPLMSPLVWDLAHIGNQEEQWLLRTVGGREALRPEIDSVYDAFEHPRAERPRLPLLAPEEARGYAADVRDRVLDVLERVPLAGAPLLEAGFAFGMIAQHEQQHDETMLITHQLRRGPAVLSAPEPPGAAPDAASLPAEVLVEGGPFTMGTSAEPWALDNERPAHTRFVPAYFLDTLPVSNGAYLRFVEDGGYADARWWRPAGREQVRRHGLAAPLFWRREGGGWVRRRFGVEEPVPLDEPVLHVSWYEAAAYAAWAGRRLPTEAEWEKAARHDPGSGLSRRYPWGDADPSPDRANLGQRHLRPAPVGAYAAGASPLGVRQLIGDVWEWTSSDFLPYPGFRAFPYREYSEVFFGEAHKVLRGGSFAVDPVACRGTFRNWDLPVRRQIFAGFRTARDAEPS